MYASIRIDMRVCPESSVITKLTKHVGDLGIQAGGRLGSRQGGRIVALVPFWYGVET